jgi:hypothetical protein
MVVGIAGLARQQCIERNGELAFPGLVGFRNSVGLEGEAVEIGYSIE